MLPSTSDQNTSTHNSSAISGFFPYSYSNLDQDVHSIVNVPFASNTHIGPFSSTPLEISVLSFSQPSSQYVVTQTTPLSRPRTLPNKVFDSTQSLAAHYGLPQILPPVPRTTNVPVRATEQPLSDFESMENNYLSMLSSTTDNNTSATPSASTSALPSNNNMNESQRIDMESAQALGLGPEDVTNIVTLILPDMAVPMSPAFLTTLPSTVPGMLDSFDSPLYDTPFSNFLNTPIIGDLGDDMGGPPNMYEGASLFPEVMYPEPLQQEKQPEPQFEGPIVLEVITDTPQPPVLTIISPTPRAFAFPISQNLSVSDSPHLSPSRSPFESQCTTPALQPAFFTHTLSPNSSLSPTSPVSVQKRRKSSCSSDDMEHRPKKGDEDYLRRPESAFILFRRKCYEERHTVMQVADRLATGQRQAALSKTISQKWKDLSPEDRKFWEDLANEKRKEHELMYPNYVYRSQAQREKDRDGRSKSRMNAKDLREHETDPESVSFVVPAQMGPFCREVSLVLSSKTT
ncbi:hypothetical protein BDQ17DRAFT_513649 [Cyathus striatus]|nr:hypothetical protein BDQ17DRAFT_513649 [Cyathus striatus]